MSGSYRVCAQVPTHVKKITRQLVYAYRHAYIARLRLRYHRRTQTPAIIPDGSEERQASSNSLATVDWTNTYHVYLGGAYVALQTFSLLINLSTTHSPPPWSEQARVKKNK
jgi:hypothetical protein